MNPRFETRSDGYERLRVWDRVEQRERYVYLHRLAAVAWGVLDGLGDDRHVHHEVPGPWLDELGAATLGVPWLTVEGGIEAVEPDEHSRWTADQHAWGARS